MIRNSKTRQDGLTKIKDKGVPNLVISVIANLTAQNEKFKFVWILKKMESECKENLFVFRTKLV